MPKPERAKEGRDASLPWPTGGRGEHVGPHDNADKRSKRWQRRTEAPGDDRQNVDAVCEAGRGS
eukprot:6222200-Amphidinium_carterae.6